jgi:hypothetical protein
MQTRDSERGWAPGVRTTSMRWAAPERTPHLDTERLMEVKVRHLREKPLPGVRKGLFPWGF